MRRDDTSHASVWRHMRHTILHHVEMVWGRRVMLGVLVVTTYLYLLTKFCFPEISRLDVTLRVMTSCDVAHKGCLGVIKNNNIFILI